MMMEDSECSEDYDKDMFFEGNDLRNVPSNQELVNEQKNMLLQRGENNSVNAYRIS